MSNPDQTPIETEVPVFDVVVSLSTGSTLESVEQLARQFGELKDAQIDSLLQALKNSPRVKIGDHVPKDRADNARKQFSKLGLSVTIIPMLSLQVKTEGDFDGRFLCRACNNRVDLPANRQCPSCLTFVDKITDEWLLKRKILEQERAKLDSQIHREDKEMKQRSQKSMEDAIRAKVREELEEEYGLNRSDGLFQGKKGLLRAAALVGLLAFAFFGGNWVSSTGLPFGKSGTKAAASKDAATADVDKMLDKVGASDRSPDGATGGSGSGSEGGGATASASGAGDPDFDDPMIQDLTGGKKMGGAGLTLEQAVAASKGVAAAVGNHTADRALDGTLPGGTASSGGTGQAMGQGAGAVGSGAVSADPVKASAAIAGAAESVIPVPIGNKQVLAADFATQLARTGQIRRAREVVKHMQQLATEPAPVVALQRADLQVQAWAMQALVDGPARKAIDQLIADSARIPDSAERAKALAQAGVVLSQHALLPPAAARALLTLAGESLKSVPDARQRTVAMGEWMVATGQVALSEATALAKAGRLSKALAVSEQLNALVKEAPDLASKARLHALQYPMNVRTGQSDKANKSLETSATLVGNMTDLGEQAALLRAVAQLAGGMALPPVQSAATALRSHIDAKPGLNTEQAYVQLSLAYAESGLRSKADEYSRLAQTRKGLTPMESSILVSELIVRSDLAAAQSLHNAGQYQEAEAVLQRVRGYLF